MNTIINAGRHDIVVTNDFGSIINDMLHHKDAGNRSIFVIADEHTQLHCLPLLSGFLPATFHLIVIKPGEINKNLQTCQAVWEQLLEKGADRNALVINLGGGMVTDLGGFVAATYKRGIHFVNIPTSLLGMVDASCGGKTGVDLNHYKNMIGLFSFPEKVIVDPVFLKTLPDNEWKNGVAEIIKHGLIADTQILEVLKNEIKNNRSDNLTISLKEIIVDMIEKAIQVKAAIVEKDPFEKNERMFLNLGHTVGHALETLSLSQDEIALSHGEAIATGMICELHLSMKLSGFPHDDLSTISSIISDFFPLRKIRDAAFQELIHIIKADKKSSDGAINCVLLRKVGEPVIFKNISADLLLESFHFYNSVQK